MEYNDIRDLVTPFIAGLAVLGVLLIFLGIILAAWASADRERRKARLSGNLSSLKRNDTT